MESMSGHSANCQIMQGRCSWSHLHVPDREVRRLETRLARMHLLLSTYRVTRPDSQA